MNVIRLHLAISYCTIRLIISKLHQVMCINLNILYLSKYHVLCVLVNYILSWYVRSCQYQLISCHTSLYSSIFYCSIMIFYNYPTSCTYSFIIKGLLVLKPWVLWISACDGGIPDCPHHQNYIGPADIRLEWRPGDFNSSYTGTQRAVKVDPTLGITSQDIQFSNFVWSSLGPSARICQCSFLCQAYLVYIDCKRRF